MDGHIMRRGTTSSCQSAASSKIVKALICSRIYTHVSNAIASTVFTPLPFTYVSGAIRSHSLQQNSGQTVERNSWDLHACQVAVRSQLL